MLRVGEQVGGQYVVEAALGSGGMGRVWQVRQRGSGARLALKVLHLTSAEATARLEREGRLQGALRHPNIVPVERMLTVAGQPALLMERVAGPSLEAFLRGRSLSVSQVDALASGLFAGIGAAHRAGIVHRDLKPANILLDRCGDAVVPRITDFGLARPSAPEVDLTTSGAALGTPQYIAPEQIRSARRVDQRADLWALGCILYELACGQRAFDGEDVYGIFQRVVAGDFIDAAALRPGLPPRWAAAIAAALVVDPDQRTGDVAALEALWTGGQALAPPAWGPALAELSVERVGEDYRLPWEADAFIGREAPLSALEEALGSGGGGGLISVVGRGGLGKTRLVIRAGWRQLPEQPGGVWFCDLTAATDTITICRALSEAAGVVLVRSDPARQLGAVLRERGRCLVILDNVEQVIAPARALVSVWREAAPEATFLVTSRAPLELPGEVLFVLPPLELRGEAVSLFVARAAARRPQFAVSASNRDDLEALLSALEGLPLAIELAAARISLMSVSQLRRRLTDRFRLLADRDAQTPRHATLRAAIDWSWQLLEPDERSALAQLSVIAGGFTVDAAEAIIALPEGAGWTADLLRSLVRKSFLRRAEADDGRVRLSLYASIREFAAEQLRRAGAFEGAGPALCDAAGRRFSRFYARDGSPEALDALHRDGGVARARALREELDNLLAACRGALSREEADTAALLFSAICSVTFQSGGFQLVGPLSEAMLACASLSEPQRLQAEMMQARLQARSGDLAGAEAALEALVTRARAAGAEAAVTLGFLLHMRGTICRMRSRIPEAQRFLQAAQRIGEQQGVYNLEMWSAGEQQLVDIGHGDPAAAIARLRALIARAQRRGDRFHEASWTISLSRIRHGQLSASEQEALLMRARALTAEIGSPTLESDSLNNLGIFYFKGHRFEEALACYQAALDGYRRCGLRAQAGAVLNNLGNLYKRLGRDEEVTPLYAEAIEIAREIGDPRSEGRRLHNLGMFALQRGRLDEAGAHLGRSLVLAQEAGASDSMHSSLMNLGRLRRAQGRPDEARALMERSVAVADSIGAWKKRTDSHLALCLCALEDEALDEACAQLDAADACLAQHSDDLRRARARCCEALILSARGQRARAHALAGDICDRAAAEPAVHSALQEDRLLERVAALSDRKRL